MDGWDGVGELLGSLAEEDVRDRTAVRPTLVAFAGDQPLLLARLRAFARGEGPTALREVLDVAVPLGADHLAASFGGRAQHLGTPGRPAVRRGTAPPRDVLLVAQVRRRPGRSAGVELRCTVRALEQGRRGPVLARGADAGAVMGPLPRTLTTAFRRPPAVPSTAELMTRTHHIITLGHELHVPEGGRSLPDHHPAVVR